MVYYGPHPSDASEGEQQDVRTTDSRFLRLYDSANLNDPSEGAYFLKRFTRAYDVVKVPGYIASFVSPDRPAEDPASIRDNLVFWRHYGKNGQGCSISIPADRFNRQESEPTLRAVAYGSEKANEGAERLHPIMQRLDTVLADARVDAKLERQVAATILESLGELPYMYKSSAYKYEQECRIVACEADFGRYGGVHYAFERRSGDPGRLRMYGHHPCLNLTNVLSTGSVITLGPTVPNLDHVEYALEQLLESVGIGRFPIRRSKISYR